MSALYTKVAGIIAEVAGVDAGDIHPEAHLQEDLGINEGIDFPKIIAVVNKTFETDIDAKELVDEGVTTVEELVTIIADESELG